MRPGWRRDCRARKLVKDAGQSRRSSLWPQRKTVTVVFCDVDRIDGARRIRRPRGSAGPTRALLRPDEGDRRAHGGSVLKFIGDAAMGSSWRCWRRHGCTTLRAVRAAAEMRDAPEPRRPGAHRRQHRRGGHRHGGTARDRGRRERRRAPRAGGRAGEVLLGAADVPSSSPAPSTWRRSSLIFAEGEVGARRGVPAAAHEPPDLAPRSLFAGEAARFSPPSSRRANACARSGAASLVTTPRPASASRGSWRRRLRRSTSASVRGRCVSYGEGITYWPAVEILKQLRRADGRDGGDDDPVAARRASRRLPRRTRSRGPSARRSSRRPARGRSGSSSTISTGPRRRSSTWSSTLSPSTCALILLVCMARPELLERRLQCPGCSGWSRSPPTRSRS